MEIRTQLFASIIATVILLGVSGFLLYDQISKVGRSFDEVQKVATPSIIALGNLKSDFNQLVASILAFSVHPSEEHHEEIEHSKEQLHMAYEEYAVVAQDTAAAQEIGHSIDSLLLVGDRMVLAAEQVGEHAEHEEGMAHDDMMAEHAGEDHMAKGATTDDHMAEAGHTDETDHAAMEGHDDAMHDEAAMDDHSAMAGETADDHMAGTTGGETMDDHAATTTTGFAPEVEELHTVLQEFDQHAMEVRAGIDGRIDAEFADMQVKQSAVLTDIENGTSLSIFLTIAVIGVIGAIGGFVAYSLSKRVIELKKTANTIAKGDLESKITTAGSDEIADLASSFEQMRKSLVQAQEELRGRNAQLSELNIVLEKANVELKKLDRLKDEFISIASHELRSPIHPILGYASMARDGLVQDKEALDIIYREAKRLQKLANDILDVSRIESGTLPYVMKDMGIHQTLQSCVEGIRPSVEAAGLSITTDFDKKHPEIELSGDSDRLTQVFMNLLGNSLKFTKKGGLSVGTRMNDASGYFEITISDTGGGIPAEILPRLFGKFVTKKVGENEAHGTGLGLFISRSIVEAHGGKISAYNGERGATFKIELPAGKDAVKVAPTVPQATK
ncbi:ATP-binding protein [Candidatus Nitrososphaera sp. FF02]|uniref:sensor histidine kinase n=1 Tax=Candidatus Nitrososphaera sp. FF02 TaxID=3398226 RepID=UPI0039EBF90E